MHQRTNGPMDRQTNKLTGYKVAQHATKNLEAKPGASWEPFELMGLEFLG